MEALSRIIGHDGELLPSKKVTVSNIPDLAVSAKSPEYEYDSDSDSDSSDEEGFYYEVLVTCSSHQDDETKNLPIIVNFGSKSNYLYHAEISFEDIDIFLHDAVILNYPEWEYADEWEETCIHGEDLPDYYDGVVVDIY